MFPACESNGILYEAPKVLGEPFNSLGKANCFSLPKVATSPLDDLPVHDGASIAASVTEIHHPGAPTRGLFFVR